MISFNFLQAEIFDHLPFLRIIFLPKCNSSEFLTEVHLENTKIINK